MGIPISGFILDSGDSSNSGNSGSKHSHKLYITSWNGRAVPHIHQFEGVTSLDVGHNHRYVGLTFLAATGVQHVHSYYAETSIDDGHAHIIQGTTGPAIPLPNGGHIHYFEGYTTVNGSTPHTHMYRGNTGNEIVE
ncbi:YmaF family protein [Paenibacillus chartarius]|uniref:YmaF family protein n=1 Tax=Paenibacillus chartarius TaxID=747481 RepID=A0ABV6DT05_9BACL